MLRTRTTVARCAAMDAPLPSSFMPVIQTAITPVILLSGVGALMLTLTNRMGRIVDRTRTLAGLMRQAEAAERAHLDTQLSIMWRRAKLVRVAVTFAGLSMLLSCMLVMGIFVDVMFGRNFSLALVVVFVASVMCLIAALGAFLRDIWMSLWALSLEVERARTTKV